MTFDDATLRQITASRPDRSTWLTANAGSGKTRVLTDRVARLLLDGVDPQNILCLTYTKAAAGEMQNRLFRTLGGWAMLSNDDLAKTLRDKGIDAEMDLAIARRLFARAIETPGGLKIQTIHSFCANLLRRFPMEAQVSPHFTEMDERTAELLRAEVLENTALSDGPDGQSLRDFARVYTDSQIESFTAGIMARADCFNGPMPADRIADALGANASGSVGDILESALGGLGDLLCSLVAALRTGSANDQKAADRLAPFCIDPTPNMTLFNTLCGVFLTGEKAKVPFAAKIGSFPTKAVQAKQTDLMADLDPLMEQVQDLRQQVFAQIAFDRTKVLYSFATHFVPQMRARMRDRGMLGFDDLILRARDLLNTPEVAAWVLWRLDGGIDHILVDEAQDTSPEQWSVIRLLSQELASGHGARTDRPRTLFVVGDRKQSIYSFQGADPREFNRMNAYFDEMLAASEAPLETMSLDHSFRSSRAILDLVDRVFAGPGSAGLEPDVKHLAFFGDMPGRVEIWEPVVAEPADDTPLSWTDPVDRVSPRAPAQRLARQIAQRIRQMVDHETLPVKSDGVWQRRAISEGDVLILVRKRGPLFNAILRECKSAGLAVAGADRLKLGGEMAVKDLLALMSFLALPEDDLALACALKSPLFGWSESDLYDLAHGRDGYLWQALRAREDHAETRAILDDLRGQADFLRPYELLSRMLIRHDGRARLLARLGTEAEEGIDALLAQALSYESQQVPSLTGFLLWIDAEDIEVKRQQGGGGTALRVMTVHGSKGLEAPIVIMPDTAKRRAPGVADLLQQDDLVFWPPAKAQLPTALGEIVADATERADHESMRLLYVGMTRAEQWLMVAAAGDVGEGSDSWYSLISDACPDGGAMETPDGVQLRRFDHGDWTGPVRDETAKEAGPQVTLPPGDPIPAPTRRSNVLSPSDLGGAKVIGHEPGEGFDKETAMARGTALHALLEHLPRVDQDAWPVIANRIAPDMPDLQSTAMTLLRQPRLAPLFREGRAEVPVTAPVPHLPGYVLMGEIDLLIERADEIIAIDFKSNAIVPETPDQTPEGILRQMGAYAAMLSQIWPDRPIKTAILWTHTQNLMDLPDTLTRSALGRVSAP